MCSWPSHFPIQNAAVGPHFTQSKSQSLKCLSNLTWPPAFSLTLLFFPYSPASKMPSTVLSLAFACAVPCAQQTSSQVHTWLAPSSPSDLCSNVTLSMKPSLSVRSLQKTHGTLKFRSFEEALQICGQGGWKPHRLCRSPGLFTVKSCDHPKDGRWDTTVGTAVGLEGGSQPTCFPPSL